MKKVIALVDCNNFFVACERLFRPELLDKPVCVLSNNDGCVVSRSNEAKRLGVPMGIPYFIAKKQFKNVIFLSGRLPFYCEISKRVVQKFKDFTPDFEIYSIDEAFLDLTNLNKTFNCTFDELIEKIVADIKEEVGIDVSIGLSYSKVLAKLACDKAKNLQKKGIDKKTYKIGYREIEKELKNTKIEEIWGVGKNTQARLKKYFINTAWDFTIQKDVWIKRIMGKVGLDLKQELLGNPVSLVDSSYSPPKSISRSESFKEFQTDKNYIQNELSGHVHKVCKILREKNLFCSTIGISLKTKDFQSSGVKINLINPTNSELEIIPLTKEALDNLYQKDIIYRSVGFWAHKLTPSNEQQISLFEGENTIKKQELSKTWDKLEEKYGKGIIKIGH